jgi:hypothetical protein
MGLVELPEHDASRKASQEKAGTCGLRNRTQGKQEEHRDAQLERLTAML